VQFSRSGLIEALGWLRKQTAQPVATFAPQLDTSVTPPLLDTIDEDVGIAREFEITNSIWGRYEVWKPWDADPVAERLAWRQQFQCEDVSGMRGDLSAGSIWKLRSVGYVYRRVDPTVPFNQAPNQVLGQDLTEVEVRRLALQPPGQAALCARSGSGVQVLTRGKVVGGSLGCGCLLPPGHRRDHGQRHRLLGRRRAGAVGRHELRRLLHGGVRRVADRTGGDGGLLRQLRDRLPEPGADGHGGDEHGRQ
jgi:hypothetical protein